MTLFTLTDRGSGWVELELMHRVRWRRVMRLPYRTERVRLVLPEAVRDDR